MHYRNELARLKRAFTLIELLVVVAIIALLIAILLPSLSKARMQAKRTKTLAHLRGIGVAMAAYENENREFHPALLDQEEKAFLGLSLLARQHNFPKEFFINPNTDDSPPAALSMDGRPALASLDGAEITESTAITPANIGQVRWHCSYAYDNDNKKKERRTLTPHGANQMFVYLGDRGDYKEGRTFSANWHGEGMCLLWTDQHGDFRKKKSLSDQSDPNIYHHNEFEGEGGEEIVDGVEVGPYTLDTHLRFFSEEEDDVLLPNP